MRYLPLTFFTLISCFTGFGLPKLGTETKFIDFTVEDSNQFVFGFAGQIDIIDLHGL